MDDVCADRAVRTGGINRQNLRGTFHIPSNPNRDIFSLVLLYGFVRARPRGMNVPVLRKSNWDLASRFSPRSQNISKLVGC